VEILLTLTQLSDYIENEIPWEYLNFIDRFAVGFLLLQGARWNLGKFLQSSLNILSY
jgi:hypothetical protein